MKAVLYFVVWLFLTAIIGVTIFATRDPGEVFWICALISLSILLAYANREKIWDMIFTKNKPTQYSYSARPPYTSSNNVGRQAPAVQTRSVIVPPSECLSSPLTYYKSYIESDTLPDQRKCREIADSLDFKANQYNQAALKSKSITAYCDAVDKAFDLLNKARKFETRAGYGSSEGPSYILQNIERDYQWHLRDAIEREENVISEEMLGPQHNNKRACCANFYDEIQVYKEYYSEETLTYAMDAYYRLCGEADIAPLIEEGFDRYQSDATLRGYSSTAPDIIYAVDSMEGYEFEEFCAELLRKNGFEDVIKTKSSGDQGVDIVAKKDGIKYAVQCKCYSSDIGNKPIQEVYTGKRYYNCQVAAVMTNRSFTTGAIKAAEATGVLLWDRIKLQDFIIKAGL